MVENSNGSADAEAVIEALQNVRAERSMEGESRERVNDLIDDAFDWKADANGFDNVDDYLESLA